MPKSQRQKGQKQIFMDKNTSYPSGRQSVQNENRTTVPQSLSPEKACLSTGEYHWQGINELTGSQFARMEIRPGFELWHYHGKFERDVLMLFRDTPPMIVFSFCFSGQSVYDYLSHVQNFEVSSCTQQVIFYPFPDFTTSTTGDTEFNRLVVLLSPGAFIECFDKDMDALPPALQQIVDKDFHMSFLHTARLNPLVQTLSEHLHQCPFTGSSHRCFFEGSALHLILLQLKALESCATKKSAFVRIDPTVQKRLQRIKELLDNCLDNPPGLSELAKEAAMSAPKLNQCFRRLYGATVFEYLRQQRFERAKIMLEQGLSVTEASLAVGYESLASFSLAFKKRFGYAPSRYFSQNEQSLFR